MKDYKHYFNGGCSTCMFAERDERGRYVRSCSGFSNCSYKEYSGKTDITEEEKDTKITDLETKLTEKVFLYKFIDNDNLGEEYCILTKHNCKELLQDIEKYFYDIIDCESEEELIRQLKENNANKILIEHLQEGGYSTDSCYCLEIEILSKINELIPFEEETFYY